MGFSLPSHTHRLGRLLTAALWGLMCAAGVGADIVGFYTVSVPAGNSAWVCGLVAASEFTGEVTSVSTGSDGKALLTFATAGWAVDGLVRCYAEPQSGSSQGLAADILSNTTDTLKLDATPAAAGISVGMTVIVRRHATLATLFADGGGISPFNDSVSVQSKDGTQTGYFFNNLTHTWIDALGADASLVIIRPGQGFVIQAAAPVSVLMGSGSISHVKSTPTRVTAYAQVSNLAGPLNPVGDTTTTLGSLGLVSSLQAYNDSVVTLAVGSLLQTGTYLSNGSCLINGSGQNATATTVVSGSSVVINVDQTKQILLSPVTITP